MKKTQKVVMRSKVRKRVVQDSFSIAIKAVKTGLALILLIFGGSTAYDYLFRKDYFLVKSVVMDQQLPFNAQLLAELKGLHGRSMFGFSSMKTEGEIRSLHPEIRRISVRRIFPDKVHVTYEMRAPLAWIKSDTGLRGLDKEGIQFPLMSRPQAIPELVFKNPEDANKSIQFLEFWKTAQEALPAAERWALVNMEIRESGELRADVRVPNEETLLGLEWGDLGQEKFKEKFERLRQVKQDLKSKNILARSIELRGVPQKGGSVFQNREVVGRVVVTLAKGGQ